MYIVLYILSICRYYLLQLTDLFQLSVMSLVNAWRLCSVEMYLLLKFIFMFTLDDVFFITVYVFCRAVIVVEHY